MPCIFGKLDACKIQVITYMSCNGEAKMCEAHAFILKDGKEEKVMESVDRVELEGDEVKLVSIFGEQKTLKASLKLYNNSEGKIVFEPL